MSEMVDRVAREMQRHVSTAEWDSIHSKSQEWWRGFARASIAAMREPTDLMVVRGWNAAEDGVVAAATNEFSAKVRPDTAANVWQAMTDAALSESDNPGFGKVPTPLATSTT